MNTLTKTIAVTALTLSSIGLVSASNVVVPTDGYVTTKICVAATKGSKAKLSRAIRKAGLSKHFVAENVKCNEQNITAFIEQYGSNAEKMNNFLTRGKYSNSDLVANVAAR